MSVLHLRWTLVRAASPRPLRHCSSCGLDRTFASSGLFRVNANGRRLDAWLIYRCTACDRTWNRAIFERHARSEIAEDLLERLQANDTELARRIECDVVGLGTLAEDGGNGWTVEKTIVSRGSPSWTAIRIDLVARGGGPRLDRLLANELALSRQAVARMAEDGRLTVEGRTAGRLRRSARDGTVVTIIEPGPALMDRATGAP